MEHSAFPSDETLAAFIDGRLDEETRKKVVAHAAECDDCYGTMMASGAWIQEEQQATKKTLKFSTRGKVASVALAAAATIAGWLLYPPVHARYAQRRDMAALSEAADELPKRWVYARVSLDLGYKERAQRLRGTAEEKPDSPGLLIATANLQSDAEHDSRAVAQHSLGLGFLLAGHYDEAVQALEKAIESETSAGSLAEAIRKSTDVALLSDLSAAHGARVDHQNGNVESSRSIALEAADRAWRLDPKSPPTLWNRALALDRVAEQSTNYAAELAWRADPKSSRTALDQAIAIERADRQRAIAAWNDYLAVDPASRWSKEARGRVQTLRENQDL